MAGLLSGVMDIIDGGASKQAQGISQQMLDEARNLPLPVLKQYYPELYKQVVSLNPETETAVNLGPSEMQGVSTDPATRQAQMNALNKLQGIGEAGGKDAQFLSDSGRLENDVNTNLQGQQGAIMQNLATRGMSGGGSELVARNMAVQSAANRQSQAGLDLNAQAQQRALQALTQSGQLGGQIQAQDFSQQSAKAAASDAINKFNTVNQQQVMANNVATKNAAQQTNATNAQSISNQNTGLNNTAQQYNANLAQQQYDNELKKRGLISQAGSGLAKSYQDESNGNRQFVGGIISAGASAGAKAAAGGA
jgi:hypothetical protein